MTGPTRTVQSSFVLMVLVLAISVGVMYWIGLRVFAARDAANQTHSVLEAIEDALATTTEAETGQRGYLLTGKPSYLNPYHSATARIGEDIATLDSLAADHLLDAGDEAQLKSLINRKLDELNQTIQVHDTRGPAAAVDVVDSDQGKRVMDEIRRLVLRLQQAQDKKLSAADRTIIIATKTRNALYISVILIDVVFLAFAYRRIFAAIVQRDAAIVDLQLQRDLVSVTLASIGDGVIVTDEQGRISYLNSEAERLTGWPLAEAAAQPCTTIFNILNEHSRQRVESPVEKVLRSGATVGLANHTVLIRKDGSELPIDDSGAPIRNTDGSVRGVVLVFRDFTEHKQNEKKLRDALSLLNTVTNSTADLIFAKDREGKMLLANAATLAMIGKTSEQVIGKNELEWHDNRQEAETIMATDRRIMELGQPQIVEETFTGADGTQLFRSNKAPLIDENGRTIGIVGISRNITEQKRAEMELAAAKEAAEAANIAKDNFLATLSHELRTPLSPVLATLSLWESTNSLPAEFHSDVQMLRRNVELEARLIDDLLDLTRIIKGKLPLNLEAVDVHELVRSVVGIYKSELYGKQLKLTLQLQALRHYMLGDPARLQQVFWNILKNAIKFTPAAGSIQITSQSGVDDRIAITFVDNGIGMEADTVARLFEPFEQGSVETLRHYGGLGLGMAISRSLVEAQGGSISAHSEGRGKGATFTVKLGTIAEPAERSAATTAAVTENTPLTILLVEDHADTARAMSRLLRSQGHTVRAAATVTEAITSADEPFDLLLSDIGLPDGTGVELIRQLREKHGEQFTAIALTGFGMEDDLQRCRDAGFNDHLTKPVNLQVLERLLQQIMTK